jgi:DUF4097 and DUF4098 domain-containing protein YvlB
MLRLIAKLTLLVSVAVLALLCACSDNGTGPGSDRFEATEQFSSAVDAGGLSVLEVEGVNGNIIIIGVNESDSVRIEAEKIVRSESTADAEEHLLALHVDVLISGSTVSVKTSQPKSAEGRDYIVNYEITVPRDFDVVVSNVNGKVTISELTSSVTASVVNGEADLNEIAGSATVAVVNGRIDSDMTLPLNGSAAMTVVNGDIDLGIPQTTSAEFSASVTNGTIAVSNLTLQNQQTTQHSVVGTLGDGEGTIALAVTNGTIDVAGY